MVDVGLTVTWVFGVSMAPLYHPMRAAAMVSYLRSPEKNHFLWWTTIGDVIRLYADFGSSMVTVWCD